MIVLCTAVLAQEVIFVGSYELQGTACDLAIKDGYAYLAGSAGLCAVDITDPANPHLAGAYETPRSALYIAVSGSYAYLTLGSGDVEDGLYIIDISDPQYPIFTGYYDMSGGYVYNLFLVGEYAYVVNHFESITIVNVSNPSNPIYEGYYDTPGQVSDGFVFGGYAFIADYYMGLHIVDISDPANPIFVGGNTSLYYAMDICVVGDYAYIAAEGYGLRIADISSLSNPVQIGIYSTDSFVLHVSTIRNRAFITESYAGLEVVDITDPSNPIFVEIYETPGYACEIVVEDEYIYIADGSSLQILRYVDPSDVPWEENPRPIEIRMQQNYPNPFNTSTTVSYSLPEPSEVTISIYNLLGQRAATVFDGSQEAGQHSVTWDASDFPSGVYFARLETAGIPENLKMVLLK